MDKQGSEHELPDICWHDAHTIFRALLVLHRTKRRDSTIKILDNVNLSRSCSTHAYGGIAHFA